MKRTLTKLSAVALVCLLLFAGCNSGFGPVAGGPSANDPVYGNGGLTVVKGDYIFFINGTSPSGADNTYGTPVKGAVVRQKIGDPEDVKIVVPKLVTSSYSKGGFYIFGDRIYYPSPSIKKDSEGKVLSSALDFFSVKLDGTDEFNIQMVSSNSTAYKFYQDKDTKTIYLVYVSGTDVYSVNAATKVSRVIAKNVNGTPVLADDGYVYFTKTLYKDDTNKEKLSYYGVMRVAASGGEAEDICFEDGTPLINSRVQAGEHETSPRYAISLLDVKVFLTGDTARTVLYYTRKGVVVDSDGINPIDMPDAHTFSFTVGSSYEKLLAATGSNFSYSNIFYISDSSFLGVNTVDSTSILYYVENSYRAAEGAMESGELESSGCYVKSDIVAVMTSTPSKILFIDDEKVYYLDSSNNLCTIQYTGITQPQVKGETFIEDVSFSSTSLMPEKVTEGQKVYLYFLRTDGYYPGYVHRILISGDEEGEELQAEFVGIATAADEKYAEERRKKDQEDS